MMKTSTLLHRVRQAAYVSFIGLSLSLASCSTEKALDPVASGEEISTVDNKNVIPGSFIVVFKPQFDVEVSRRANVDVINEDELTPEVARARKADAYRVVQDTYRSAALNVLNDNLIGEEKLKNVYGNALSGFSANLSNNEVARLKADPRVAYIEPDYVYQLEDISGGDEVAVMNTQSTPWGITRVGGAGSGVGLSRWAWVIDSGIDLDHPDLTVNTQLSRTFVSGTANADDQNGHGTHVAGTIAARNNTIGVVGVAAGATVVSVRVFGATGGSSNATIIAGIDYVTANALAGDVANLSLGGPAALSTDDAVRRLAAKGVRCAVAAGNESQNANNVSPARVNGTNIWTISAHDVNDRFASFSNFANPPIDFCAPGVSVNSCWLNGGYRSISGTSMATPHVAGILLLSNGIINSRGRVIGDRDTNADILARR